MMPANRLTDATMLPRRATHADLSFTDVVADLVPLRGWRLARVLDALRGSIKHELRDGDAGAGDSGARRLLERKYGQALGDALSVDGPFAPSPRAAALLTVRYADRAAFEAYGTLHARLTALATAGATEAVTLPDMLLALRLRMLCLDWAAIALVLGALQRPCDVTALRKRHSRLNQIAANDPAGAQAWSTIDAYLKARGRSFGGSRRRVPAAAALAAMLALLTLAALAVEVWRATAPPAPRGEAPPQSPSATPAPPAAPARDPAGGAGDIAPRAPPPVRLPEFLVPSDGTAVAVTTPGLATELSQHATSDGWLVIRAATVLAPPPATVRRALLDHDHYGRWVPHLARLEMRPNTGGDATELREWAWPDATPVSEVVREFRLSDASVWSRPWNAGDATAIGAIPFIRDDMRWLLKQEGLHTRLQFDRFMRLPAGTPDLQMKAVLSGAAGDVPAMFAGLEHEAQLWSDSSQASLWRRPCTFQLQRFTELSGRADSGRAVVAAYKAQLDALGTPGLELVSEGRSLFQFKAAAEDLSADQLDLIGDLQLRLDPVVHDVARSSGCDFVVADDEVAASDRLADNDVTQLVADAF